MQNVFHSQNGYVGISCTKVIYDGSNHFLLSFFFLPLFYMQIVVNRDSYTDTDVGGGVASGDESPRSISSFLQDKDFILDCLCWHNEFRARHSAPALTVSPEVSICLMLYNKFQTRLLVKYYGNHKINFSLTHTHTQQT